MNLSFGIIGLGSQGTVYGRLLEEMEGIILGGVSSRDQQKENLFPEVPFFSHWKELVESRLVSAVIVTTPHKNHVEIAEYCIRHGVAVLVDKPMGTHVLEVEALNQLWAKTPEVGFGILFNQRTNPVYAKARELVQSGELGPLRKVDWICCNWWRPDSYYQQSSWRGTWTGEGGGILMNQAPHQLDIWQWICGMPSTLYAKVQFGAYRDITVENDVSMVVTYDNGAMGTFQTCAYDPLGTDRLEITLESGKLLIEGGGKKLTVFRLTQGETAMNQTLPLEEVTAFIQGNPLQSMYTKEEWGYMSKWGEEHRLCIENFAQHLRDKTPLLAEGTEGLHSLMLANGALLSHHLGKEISLPFRGEDYLTWLEGKIEDEAL